MKRIFIGHRGVGKTSLLKRHLAYFPGVPHFDLDAEIEKNEQKTISQIFLNQGEKYFRRAEMAIFNQITQSAKDYVLALGAGFEIEKIDKTDDMEFIFVSRVTDQDGRIFTDRPRLNADQDPLEEWKIRYNQRQPKFLQYTDKVYFIPEGVVQAEVEAQVLRQDFSVENAYYTLAAKEIKDLAQIVKQFKKIELRTDLLGLAQIQDVLHKFSEVRFLVSLRTAEEMNLKGNYGLDCDVKFLKGQKLDIVSSHSENLKEAIAELATIENENSNIHFKISPIVDSMEELKKGFEWQQQKPDVRSFLPRSRQNGKWLWYRQLSKYFQKLNFIRNATMLWDQPSLSEWLILPKQKPNAWGAVLGSPVYFSRSPQQHLNFFQKKNSFFTRIELSISELEAEFDFLKSLGLKYAAVTSPLKETAHKISKSEHPLEAVNTLWLGLTANCSCNTDTVGFLELVKSVKGEVAVWGGGGTLQMMKSVLPHATYFSSQTGLPREGHAVKTSRYSTLIWAAPRTKATKFPPDSMQVESVIDLNYAENSMGLEFASNKKMLYTSGIKMFEAQADEQQKFWRQCESK